MWVHHATLTASYPDPTGLQLPRPNQNFSVLQHDAWQTDSTLLLDDDQRCFLASQGTETWHWVHNDINPQLGPVRHSPGHQSVLDFYNKTTFHCGLV